MRAIISDGRSIRLDTQHPLPQPAAGEAVVRPTRVLVSPFDVATARGETAFKGVIGHQFVGVVETIHGDAAASRKLVNRRVIGSIISSCNECDLCRKGLSNHCRRRTLMGICGRDGCMAERFTIAARQLTPVPASIDDDQAVFAFELASALHTAQQLTIANRPFITILGDGVLALIMGQVLSRLNASVRVVGADAQRLDLCSKWGVKHRLLDDVGMRNDQDIVIDCTGGTDGSCMHAALGLVRPRGKLVLKSLTHAPLAPASLDAVVRHEIEVIGSFAGPMSEAVATLAANSIDVVSLSARRVSLRGSTMRPPLQAATIVTFDD